MEELLIVAKDVVTKRMGDESAAMSADSLIYDLPSLHKLKNGLVCSLTRLVKAKDGTRLVAGTVGTCTSSIRCLSLSN